MVLRAQVKTLRIEDEGLRERNRMTVVVVESYRVIKRARAHFYTYE